MGIDFCDLCFSIGTYLGIKEFDHGVEIYLVKLVKARKIIKKYPELDFYTSGLVMKFGGSSSCLELMELLVTWSNCK